jgi:D-sedoheptulose 7-phosphate isomerase
MSIHSKTYFSKYFSTVNLKSLSVDIDQLKQIANLMIKVGTTNNKVIICGNGGSASIANHLTIDLINAANITAVNFNDPVLITCFSNDYGYENWVSKALDSYANADDLLILISSSGNSENMLNATKKAKCIGVKVVTLTGFSINNPLRELGDINLWVDSKRYNIVEITHNTWLLSIVDYIIDLSGRREV